MRRATAWLVVAALLAPVGARADRAPREVRRFQEPTAERSIADEVEDEGVIGGGRADLPADLEDTLYLRERPDSLGAATREFHDHLLETLLAEREGMVVTRRLEAIRLLERFVATEPESAPEMPDALLRLAELKWERARAEYIAAFGAWQRVPQASRGPEPTMDYRAAIALYDRLLTRHPDFERNDLVLYMKAYALVELGANVTALDLYRRILAEYPRSRFVPDAHFALAEDHFNAGQDFEAALREYELVMRDQASDLFDISLFKSAWCLWRLGRSQDAALRFRQVLDLGAGSRAGLSADQRRRLRDLQDEALDYLIQVFIEDEGNTASDLFRFLQEIGGERYANRVLRRLSDTYMSQARYERAIEAYELLLSMDATVPEAPDYRRVIARAYAAMGDVEASIRQLRVLAETYAPGSRWATQQSDPDVVARTQRRTERAIRTRALRLHQEGQRENQNRLLERAVELYTLHHERFPRSAEAYRLQFYKAEILFHRLQRYPEAGEAYLTAARLEPRGEYTRDALYNAIGAFERVRERELEACAPRGPQRGGPQRPTPTPPAAPARAAEGCAETANDRKFGQAIELYVQLFPEDPDLPEILFRQGRLYYDRGVYDPAVRLFGQLLERFPESDFAEPAGDLILDSFNRAADYANIEVWARRLKGSPAFRSDESQRRLDRIILEAVFEIGEQLARRGEHAKASAAYFRAANEFPRDERARQAFYNAGLEAQRAGDLSGAARAYDRLIAGYHGTAEGALGAWAAAQMYESIAQFRDAAGYYEQYGQHFPRGEKAQDAIYNAVVLRLAAGDWDEAASAARVFLERHPRSELSGDVYFFLGRAHEGAERWEEAARVYREYIRRSRNADRTAEAMLRLAQVVRRDGDAAGAGRELERAVRFGQRSRRQLTQGLYYVAQARYLQGDEVLAQYEAIRIAGDTEGLRGRLERKSQLLARAAEIYADVVSYGVAEWVTASLYQIGRSFELFAIAMNEFEVPEGLDEEEEMAYRDQLASFIIPMEERALEAYEGGYRRALELRIFNRWTAQLREALTRLNEVQYPPLREIGAEFHEEAPLAMPAPLEGVRRRQAAPQPSAARRPAGGRSR